MSVPPEALRDWHRLFGLLLTDFFSGSPFVVEVERDLSVQQQLLDVVIVRRGRGRFAGRLPDGLDGLRPHNLVTFKSHHAFSAAPPLVAFGSGAYRRRSQQTSRLLGQLFERLQGEGFAMSFTMEDFNRQYVKEHFPRLTPEERRETLESLPPNERREVLQSLPAEELLAVLSADQIRQYLDQLTAGRPAQPRKPRRKR